VSKCKALYIYNAFKLRRSFTCITPNFNWGQLNAYEYSNAVGV
jgi:hypothetical protein